MAIHPPGFGNNSGETVDALMAEMPNREVFVKDTDGSLVGTGMRMLPDGALLAPDGFSVESGSIDFGDAITMSESSGFVGIRNNLYNQMYQLVDYNVPRNAASKSPSIFKLDEAEWMFTAQTDDTSTLTANPLIFNYTTTLNARTNSITFRAAVPMTNVRIKITKSDVNVALKYLPSKSVWTLGTGGMSFVAGDNIVDFKDSPVPLSAGVMLTFEIRATAVNLKGNSSGIPYFGVMTQRGEFASLPLSSEVTANATRDKLTSLTSPNKLPKTAIQDGVLSVNGQFGDVMLDYEDVGAQPLDSTLQEISDLSITNNSLLHISATGHVDQIPISSAGKDWLTYTTADAQKNQLGLATVASSGSYTDLADKPILFSGSYTDLTNKPSIPAAQVNTDWNSVSGVSQLLNKPILFSGTYADLTGKPVLFSGSYTDLTNKPTLFDGTYASLTGKPTIPSAQIQSDWNQSTTSALDYIKNKPTIPVVSYPVVSVNTKTGAVVLSASDVGAIATGASIPYSTLTGTPTIPAAQVQTDWNAVSGLGVLLNKPTTFTPSAHTQAWTTITSTPTTLLGYGITDAYPLSSNPSGYLTGITSGQVTTALGFTPYNSTNPSAYVNQAGARTALSLTTTGTSGASTYNSTTGVLNVPNYTSVRTFTNPTRTLNTAFQISSTQDSQVSYSVDITVAALLIGGSSGRVYLEYANEVGFTTGVTTVASSGQSTGGVLSITNLGTANLNGVIPAGKFVRLRTVNVTATPTFAFQSAQEVLL